MTAISAAQIALPLRKKISRPLGFQRGNLPPSLDTRHLKAKAIKLFPALASVEWEYDWAGYVAITSPMRPLLTKLGNNAFAGLGYNGRGITTATSMGKQLAQALKGQSTSIPIEGPKPMPFHRCYPIGVTSHIVSAHIRDYFTTPMTK